MVKIAIGVPTPQFISPDFMRNVIGIIAKTSEMKDLEDLEYLDKSGVRTDRNRNYILQHALDLNMDYILWLDSDMLYPHDIILKYLQSDFDVMGCLYFKRSSPYDPVGYVKGDDPLKPFHALDPRLLPKDAVLEVDGLGFGGMMVNMKVYKAMGDDKWMKYGDNFHLPYKCEGQLTHDLEFCRTVQKHGFKIFMHTGIRPGHIADYVVTEEDWQREHQPIEKKEKKITVIMPTIHPEMAEKTAKILTERAGIPFDIVVIEDTERKGYVKICNDVVKITPSDYYAYVTDDVFPSRLWLKSAIEVMEEHKAGLFGFNDGKWNGAIATCGVVTKEFMQSNYGGDLFYPKYFGHYNDTELTMMATAKTLYVYSPNVSLIEIDYEKDTKHVNPLDKALFSERKKSHFDGKIIDQALIDKFA